MIHYVAGDIILTKADAIAHGVAPGDNMKQGLALTLRERWPAMYKDFRHYCTTTHPKEGTVWAWKGPQSRVIFNLMTQEHPSSKGGTPGKATSSHVLHSLKELKKAILDTGVKSLAITKISTGVGGLDWAEVKPMIESTFSDMQIPVYVYETFHAGEQANEN